jgi:hopene-associated glycosyltransferase HpnB
MVSPDRTAAMKIVLAMAMMVSLVWLYLLVGRGFFWRAGQRDVADADSVIPAVWPGVIAVVPARDEAELIGCTMASLAAQDYRGPFGVILVDDQSRDGTAAQAVAAAASAGTEGRLTVLSGVAPPPGWTGKLWAVEQGVAEALGCSPLPRYLWLCDADIRFAPDTLTSLVRRAEAGDLVLASLMAKLRCSSFAERCLIPAFIFFFQMLYPFGWVNAPDRSAAAAAGGCMLVRRDALAAAGGIGGIRNALIDDCALGSKLKDQGPVWLGLSDRALSMRRYEHFGDIRGMVARSAYAQLGYSPLWLALTVVAMAFVFLSPPLLAIFATGPSRWLGAADWLAMAGAYVPTLRFYRMPAAWAVGLPLIACAYVAFTIDSAYQHLRGRGGLWKDRVQAISLRGK